MNIKFLGHASFLVEGKDECLLTDPWFSKSGAFNYSWFQYPYNHHLAENILKLTKKLYIYISHQHQDHFDEKFLKSLNQKNVVLLIPNFKNQTFKKIINKEFKSYKKKFLNEEHLFKTNEFKFRVFMNEDISDSDSAILIENNGEKFLNQNDCKIFDKIPYIQKKYGHISIYTCQFSGATWHPHCFDYPKKQEEKITSLKKRQKFQSLLKSINELKCDYFIPSAGPAIFLDPVLEKISLKKNSIFCDHKELNDYIKKKLIKGKIINLLPGMKFNSIKPSNNIKKDEFAIIYLTKSKKEYLYWYRKKVNINFNIVNKIPKKTSVIFSKLKQVLTNRLRIISKFKNIDGEFNVGILNYEYVYKIDLKKKTIKKFIKPKNTESQYTIFYNENEIWRLLNNQMSWEEVSLTFRSKIIRNPDNFNINILAMLFGSDHDLLNIDKKKKIKKERMIIEFVNQKYSIDRFCPHQGADLKYGYYEKGYWVCPRHGWNFCLKDRGKSTNNLNYSINAKKI